MSITKVKMKVVPWFDKKKKKIFFGIDIRLNDLSWAHVKDDKGPLFYDTKPEAKKAMLELSDKLANVKLP